MPPSKPTKPLLRKPVAAEPEFEFEIVEPKRLDPRNSAVTLVMGPAGNGKSKFLSSYLEEGKGVLIATLQRETRSWGYQSYLQSGKLDAILIEDRTWAPLAGRFETDAFERWLECVRTLHDDNQYKVVLIDNMTEVGKFAWHLALSGLGVGSPADFDDKDNRFRPYTKIADLMQEALDALLLLLTAPLPKHVGLAWHTQPVKQGMEVWDAGQQRKVQKPSGDQRAADIEYGGSVLPMLQGNFRTKVASTADIVVFADIQHRFPIDAHGKRIVGKEKRPYYVLQVQPDEDRHTKIPGPMPEEKYIDNSWKSLKRLLSSGGKEGGK